VSVEIAPSVLADWGEWTAQFEGRVRTLYLDVKGLVTTGLGCLVDPVGLALALPWERADGTPADGAEVVADWHRVKALPPGLVFSRYVSSAALYLSNEAIDDLARSRLQQDADRLAFCFFDLATYPAPAQRALLSMAWAMGPGFPVTWPHFSAAVRARNWALASASCEIDSDGNPGVVPRNKANAALFLAALTAA
jgi:GH24 family phage-related lysozyme (muramidase)